MLDLKKGIFSSATRRIEELPSQIKQHSNNFKGSTRILEFKTCSRVIVLFLLIAVLFFLPYDSYLRGYYKFVPLLSHIYAYEFS